MRKTLALCLLLAAWTWALPQPGLTGLVVKTAPNGYVPVPDVEVRLVDRGRSTQSDARGFFTFDDLEPGTYRVAAAGIEVPGRVDAAVGGALVIVLDATASQPDGPGTVYAALSARPGVATSSPILDVDSPPGNYLNYLPALLHQWRFVFEEKGLLEFRDLSQHSPVTAHPNAIMVMPPANPGLTGYKGLNTQPFWLAFAPSGKRLYVSTRAADESSCIEVFVGHKLVTSMPLGRNAVTDLAADAERVYATIYSSRPALAVMGHERRFFPLPSQPNALLLPDLVALDDGRILRLDMSTGSTMATGQAGQRPTGIARLGDRLYVVNSESGDLSVLSYPDLTSLERKPLGPSPQKVVAGNGRIYVSLRGSNRVAILDAATLTVQATPEVGAAPVGLALHQNRLYVACREGATLVTLDATTGKELHRTTPQPASAPFGVTVRP